MKGDSIKVICDDVSGTYFNIQEWQVTLKDIKEFSKLNEAYDLNSLPVNHSGLTLFMSTCIGAEHIPKKELNDILQCLSNSKNFNIDKVENSFCLNVVLRKW